uniref:Venom allergen-like protein 14 n=2 Tax=Schistosoma mansoni TaxID=6183 RepID=A3RK86_SCHMA|nr:venom allergen-like protein 14 [Schistosoma mansoni]
MYSNLLCLMFTLFILLFFHEDVYCNKDLNKNSRKLLALHRKYRQDLVDCKVNGQPPAEYMSKLKWNYDLAQQAQSLASYCILRQGKPRSKKFTWVGQNIAFFSTINSAVDAWFNEHKLYNYSVNNCPKCVHYKQMVWAKTTDIGCGVANCQRYGLSVVCYYGPGGNWINEKPYKVKPHNLCPIVQSIPKDHFQTNRVHTRHGQKSINLREKKGVKYRPK